MKQFGALDSSVGRASDSRSRGLGSETSTGHLVVRSDFTQPAPMSGDSNGINTVQKKECLTVPFVRSRAHAFNIGIIAKTCLSCLEKKIVVDV